MNIAVADINLPRGVVVLKTFCMGTLSVFLIKLLLLCKMKYSALNKKFSGTFGSCLECISNSKSIIITYQKTSRSGSMSPCSTFLKFMRPTAQRLCRGCWDSFFSCTALQQRWQTLSLSLTTHNLHFSAFTEASRKKFALAGIALSLLLPFFYSGSCFKSGSTYHEKRCNKLFFAL